MEQRKKQSENFRRTIRLNDEMYAQIAAKAAKEKVAISALMRRYIQQGLSATYYDENDGKVRAMIREELSIIFDRYMERLIKIEVKGGKTSAAALYALMNLLAANFVSETTSVDMLASAFKQACAYMHLKDKSADEYVAEAKEFLHDAAKITKKDDN